MPLVDSAHREVGEGVLRVVVETHHVRLVLDGSIEASDAEIISPVTILIVHIGRQSLGRAKIRNQGISCARRKECPIELRSIQEITGIGIYSMTARDKVLSSGLH